MSVPPTRQGRRDASTSRGKSLAGWVIFTQLENDGDQNGSKKIYKKQYYNDLISLSGHNYVGSSIFKGTVLRDTFQKC